MRQAIVAFAAVATSLVAGAAFAGTPVSSTAVSSPPNLANILQGTTQTSFVILPSGSFSRSAGDFLRIKGNSGSVTPAVGVTLKCVTQGTGSGCNVLKTIAVTVTANGGTGWPGTVKDFAISNLSSGATLASSSGPGTTVTFTLNCTGSGGHCSDETITFNLGMTMVFNAPPPATPGPTSMPFTVSSQWKP